MVKLVILGWYGTETIGDRAILSSLFMKFKSISRNIQFTIASIYPFYTERTCLEDNKFWSKYCDLDDETINGIRIIDARSPSELNRAIREADYVVMGGGPLDDMAAMYMVEHAFLYAKHHGKRSMMYGCGLNVIKEKQYKKSAKKIIENADVVILRDKKSKLIAQQIGITKQDELEVAIDPAVFCLCSFQKKYCEESRNENYIAVNLRDFPQIYAIQYERTLDVNKKAFECLNRINFEDIPIKLVAMNYFAAGKDDRDILNRYCYESNKGNIEVINNPLSLEETLKCFAHARYCIGMRFHSVVIQTILNGNNYILDYTDPQKGKISAFIEQIEGKSFYENRMVNLQSSSTSLEIRLSEKRFQYSKELIEKYDEIYEEGIQKLLCIK